MPKGQQRGNREAKKPKAKKATAPGSEPLKSAREDPVAAKKKR